MDDHLNIPCEQIDACVFSGDLLHDKENRDAFRLYVERWARALNELDEEMANDDLPSS